MSMHLVLFLLLFYSNSSVEYVTVKSVWVSVFRSVTISAINLKKEKYLNLLDLDLLEFLLHYVYIFYYFRCYGIIKSFVSSFFEPFYSS